MNEKPQGELLSQEQRERTKRYVENEITHLNDGNIEDPKFLIDTFRNAGETRFTIDIIKIRFDQVFKLFRQSLTGKLQKIMGDFGHEGTKAARLYSKEKDKIPDIEIELHKRGKALQNLRNVYYIGFIDGSCDQAIVYYESNGLNEHVQKVREINSLYTSGASEYYEVRDQLIKDELENFCDHFSEPLFDPEDAKKVIKQIQIRMNELLDKLGYK